MSPGEGGQVAVNKYSFIVQEEGTVVPVEVARSGSMADDLSSFLRDLHLEKYLPALQENDVNDLQTLREEVLEDEEVIAEIGISKVAVKRMRKHFSCSSGSSGSAQFNKLFGSGELLSVNRGDRIGSGGFGTVYGGQARMLGGTFGVAVKVPSERLDPTAKDAFVRESRNSLEIAMSCGRGVCKVYALCESAEFGLCLVMKRYHRSLRDEIYPRAGGAAPLTAQRAQRVATDVCRGMAQLHARGVLLRDLKPANVLIDAESGEAVVADFG